MPPIPRGKNSNSPGGHPFAPNTDWLITSVLYSFALLQVVHEAV